jgi:hypothetical protein
MSARGSAPVPEGRDGARLAPVCLQVREVDTAPPGFGRLDRDRFRRRILSQLREEFGEQLEIEYQALSDEAGPFLPQVSVQGVVLSADCFPSLQLLRFTIARHIALEQLVQALIQEAELEAAVQGFDHLSWQEALLALAQRGDPL